MKHSKKLKTALLLGGKRFPLSRRWKSGNFAKSACLSDNQCFGPVRIGEWIYCVTEKKEKAS